MSIPRGIRNNNPGNIRISSSAWQGKISPSKDSSFEQFTSMELGIRALVKLLRTYKTKYNLNSLSKLIGRYAPTNENNTAAYVAYLRKFSKDTPDLQNPEELKNLIRGIINVENGEEAAKAIPDSIIIKGIELAGMNINSKKKNLIGIFAIIAAMSLIFK